MRPSSPSAGSACTGVECGRAVDAGDTMVATEQTMDTTIVTQDTTVDVDVDTIEREGNATVRDTVQR